MNIKELAEISYNQTVVVLLDKKQGDNVIEDRFLVSAGQLVAAGFPELELEPDNVISFGSPSVFQRLKAAVETVRKERNQ